MACLACCEEGDASVMLACSEAGCEGALCRECTATHWCSPGTCELVCPSKRHPVVMTSALALLGEGAMKPVIRAIAEKRFEEQRATLPMVSRLMEIEVRFVRRRDDVLPFVFSRQRQRESKPPSRARLETGHGSSMVQGAEPDMENKQKNQNACISRVKLKAPPPERVRGTDETRVRFVRPVSPRAPSTRSWTARRPGRSLATS